MAHDSHGNVMRKAESVEVAYEAMQSIERYRIAGWAKAAIGFGVAAAVFFVGFFWCHATDQG